MNNSHSENNSRSGQLRDLMARLSDGILSREEAGQLNRLLQADPIAQEQYLDHLLIDGLLEREFGGTPLPLGKTILPHAIIKSTIENRVDSTVPVGSPVAAGKASDRGFFRTRAARWSLPPILTIVPVLTVVLVASVWLFWRPLESGREQQQLQLANSGFEEGHLIFQERPLTTAWTGDIAEMIEHFSGITPHEGRQMVRFVESVVGSEDACELYQIVELGEMADLIASRPTTVEASAFFNAIEAEDHSAFDITVFAFSTDPALHPDVWPTRRGRALIFNGSQVRADADVKSWQQVSARLNLPADTRYLVVRLSVFRNDPEHPNNKFPGQFADNVTLNLIGS